MSGSVSLAARIEKRFGSANRKRDQRPKDLPRIKAFFVKLIILKNINDWMQKKLPRYTIFN